MFDNDFIELIFPKNPFVFDIFGKKIKRKGFFIIEEVKLIALYEKLQDKELSEKEYFVYINDILRIVFKKRYKTIIEIIKESYKKLEDTDIKLSLFIKQFKIDLFVQIQEKFYTPLFDFLDNKEVKEFFGFNKNNLEIENKIEDKFSFMDLIYFVYNSFNVNDSNKYFFNIRTVYFFIKYKEEKLYLEKFLDLKNQFVTALFSKDYVDKKGFRDIQKMYNSWSSHLEDKFIRNKGKDSNKTKNFGEVLNFNIEKKLQYLKKYCEEKGINIAFYFDKYLEYVKIFKKDKKLANKLYSEYNSIFNQLAIDMETSNKEIIISLKELRKREVI